MESLIHTNSHCTKSWKWLFIAVLFFAVMSECCVKRVTCKPGIGSVLGHWKTDATECV